MNELIRHHNPSVRLRAALDIGTNPNVKHLDVLIERCAIEPDFGVRETLTWALTRHSSSTVVPLLVEQVRSGGPQARSQALHTLSKVKDRQAWPVITPELVADPDDEVARSAWRAAVVLVPEGRENELALMLSTQLGRGEREVQLSLSRALIALGEVIEPVLRTARSPKARAHAAATEQLLRDPDSGFAPALDEAKRVTALGTQS
ncbi:MAG: HEAT repeat domain-containing protein [Rhodococcus sp. (in: high G+C Gram-positive bacteria)]